MTVDKIIEGLEMFDDNIACAYEDCPIYRTELQACKDGEEVCLCFREAIKILRSNRKGKWKLNKNGSGTCSECHFTQMDVWDYDNWQNYCGHCGADMR